MSLVEIQNVVLLLSNPVWSSGSNTAPDTVVRNITALSNQIAYEETITSNLTTLTTSDADTVDGTIEGLLYVPSLDTLPSCDDQQYQYIPENVTRRSDLPPTNYNLIAIAPWFSMECTQAYLNSARLDPIRAFIFYKPNNSTNKPQGPDSPVWSLGDDGSWQTANKFPIFAVSGLEGTGMVQKLGLYSGNVSEVPHGQEIQSIYGPNPDDYIKIWTKLTIQDSPNMPGFWLYILIVIGALLLVVAGVSITMQLTQRRRRYYLQKQVETGEVDLEAMGIKRLTVPDTHVKTFPLFTYQANVNDIPTPSISGIPASARSARSARSVRSSARRTSRRNDAVSVASDAIAPPSIRSQRSCLSSKTDTVATNFQPDCQICLSAFEHRVTIIRELPCGHIFHPDCIDEYLTEISSLCPVCRQCMLPRGYSPKITNGMVRRERAIRRLREKIDFDEASPDSDDGRLRRWRQRILRPITFNKTSQKIPLQPVTKPKPSRESTGTSHSTLQGHANNNTSAEADGTAQPSPGNPPAPVKHARHRATPFRGLRVLPTQPEDAELKTTDDARKPPASFIRQRMRQLATKNAPIDDSEASRPRWKRVVTKVFPGL